MSRKWVILLNLGLAAFVVVLAVLATSVSLSRSSEIAVSDAAPRVRVLPQNAFQLDKNSYDSIGPSLFTLQFTPPKMQLPDMRKLLTYYGPNGRPDMNLNSDAVYFGLANSKEQGSVSPGDRLFLLFDRTQSPPRYIFSPGNSPTTLWIETKPDDKGAQVTVAMMNEEGAVVSEPSTRSQFQLPQKEFARFHRGSQWKIGENRVDGTLLARQKAKWYGSDKFFERHGGEEYEDVSKKQRIDFMDEDEIYSVYVSMGDSIFWDGERWQSAELGPKTEGKPLMQLKKVADRLLTFDLWNGDGSHKVVLNLLKSQERWSPQQIQQDFRFVSARTRSQYVFEVDKDKMTLAPQDWLVKTESGWEKLDTIDEIDDFVDRKVQGPLFIFDGIEKRDDRQVLVGTLFNSSRTDMKQVELDIPQSSITVIQVPKNMNKIMGNGDETDNLRPFNGK